MTTIIGALTNQLTFQDNFASVINQVTFIAAASADLNTISFVWPYPRQPIHVSIHTTRTDGTYPPIYPIISWNLINGNIMVNGIQGLTASVSYNITLVAY